MSTRTIDIHDTKTTLSELVSSALQGDEVIIAEGDKPVARLVSVLESMPARVPGLNRGQIWVSEDFDAPLPESFWTGTE
jgi:antitoxin (DNA-binding transcriptional repressor) of toxin-antitoxin stability system